MSVDVENQSNIYGALEKISSFFYVSFNLGGLP